MEDLVILLIKGIYHGVNSIFFRIFIRPNVIRVLNNCSPYYRSIGEKSALAQSVWSFVKSKQFIARERGHRQNFRIKIIIGAYAMQLAWRLSEDAYDYYTKIILYNDYYRSNITNQYHKAEVNPGLKLIVFSVRAIEESISHHNDGLNVLLHEFAHALWLEHKLVSERYKVFDNEMFEEVMRNMRTEFETMQHADTHFFRKYAFTNEAEFFAVAVENFFERPQKFANELPDLYKLLVKLMKQDPSSMIPSSSTSLSRVEISET
jgi:hypothetical protein